jgi:hypothetical protein
MADGKVAEPTARSLGWQAHRDAQRKRLAGLPLAEKLAWLEEAQRLVDHLEKQRHSSHSSRRRGV